ncbi:hypothetical protein EDB85DRAFT_2280334 [Lactarius pseudohatsudake]|nr:hypothetical protein EDB85DRAFT_2280334 [Lactarius pseudohatsudake]
MGLAGNEVIKVCGPVTETLRNYGVGHCVPPGFYSTIDHIADLLSTEASILYSQGFSTIPCMIPTFAKCGDIIVAGRGIDFDIQKGLQISHSTVRWFDHNDLKSLEGVLLGVEKERRKRHGPLTRRFIVTEGIFEKNGAMVDITKLCDWPRVRVTRWVSVRVLPGYGYGWPVFNPRPRQTRTVMLQDSGGLVITFTKVSSHPLDTSRHMSTQPASAAPLTCRSLFFFFYPFRPGRTSHDCNDFAAPSTPPPAPAAPRPRHLDLAVTPSTLPTRLQPPPRPRHAAATSTRPPLPTQPRYDASTSAVHLDLHRRRLDIAPTATPTPLRRFHQRRAPQPAPAPSRHSPHSHLNPATTLPPVPRTLTRTGAVSTQPPQPP